MQCDEPRPTTNIPRSYFLIVLDIAPPSDLYAAAVAASTPSLSPDNYNVKQHVTPPAAQVFAEPRSKLMGYIDCAT
ncbi:hypothetical protein CY34DRAFT_809178 [Suillus luteus UH-Slu-Lm8-n1]|uniref:Uncharacterized protein n=1 Tax=Suillus luteus UH-Slu-Lm8-n1 TaxID=930992 RepID=A0A0D0AKH5_9AGAM|nr:hypothetical protein CY34DRAFT_809178 [Suillus luteus UH-Slu-Lm8-n1]